MQKVKLYDEIQIFVVYINKLTLQRPVNYLSTREGSTDLHHEKSKRHQQLPKIKKLASAVPNYIDKVCVMVNPDLTTIEHVLSNTSINTIQLHGTESIDFYTGN